MQQVLNKFGLEATEKVVWQGWQPGGEYTKNITLKNVDIKAKKLRYKIPTSRFFTTKYPQPIILSSGTSMTLPITFRPLEKNMYKDKIVFETKEGKFSVPMTAVLPEADLLLQEVIDFGFCAVSDKLQKTFDILNYSELEVSFKLTFSNPFDIKPNKGFIQPNSKATVTVYFKPQAAYVYQCAASCKFGSDNDKGQTKNFFLQGTGKYAYLIVKYGEQVGHDINIDFKNVAVNTMSSKIIELVNQTPVNAPFQVIQPSLDTSVDKAFHCSQYHGIVPGNSSLNLKIAYTPSIYSVPQADSFQILALGATSCGIIKCIGQGRGPSVTLDASSISFGLADIGKEVTRAFQITNHSLVDAVFQLQIDNDFSVFHMDVKSGKLKKGTSQTIKVTFVPEKPINYYRRVICLVHNQDPLYLDLFGTCHSDQITPGVLQKKHIERYDIHKTRGLSRISPEDLRSWLKDERIFVGEDGCLEVKDDILNDELVFSKVEDGPMEEFFNDGTVDELSTTVPHICVDVRSVEFSRCTPGQVYHKTINVTNHTQGKVSCIWNSGKKGNPFSVQPSESDILPLQSISFSIRFKPTVSGQFFSAEVEGFAFYKSMRDHRLVEDATMCPPWCLTTIATGHTFPQKSETFLPDCEFNTRNLIFSPVTTINSSYKTLLLTNNGKNPVDFAFDEDESRAFSCKPARGLLQDQFQVIVFRYTPDDYGTCTKSLACRINASEKYTKDINLAASAEIPDLQIQANGAVYFQPTYVGTTSELKVSLKNPCRIPLRFDTAAKAIVLRLIGEGQMGSLSCYPEELDLGNVVVGITVSKSVSLQNESDCGLHYTLVVDETEVGSFSEQNLHKDSKESDNASSHKAVELTCLCTVVVKGVYPTLAINDVRGLGCVQGYSRKRLWNILSIDRFNSCLDADPGSQELLYKVPTRHSTRRRMPVHTRAVLDFNFGSAPHLSESCQVLINLQNTGSAIVEWNFLFPTDLQLDIEFWAQTGEFDDDELHEMFVLDQGLFSIHPKKGKLFAGESQVVSLAYSHSAVGVHRLPVLFKVSRGREILLNFIGHTVSPDERYLHFSNTKHMFDPIPVGKKTPPIQMFPLHNGGGQPVEFQLDVSPLDEIQEKNCGWKIFECLNPTGIINPGETIFISWIFSPLEAKMYSVDVMIHVIGGESNFVTFTGVGYEQSVMGPTMNLADQNDGTLPKKQLIPVAEQLMYLSEERLSFDNVPLLSAVKRVLFLKNVSTTYAISFRWLLEKSPVSEVISIEPAQGYIEPSESSICKVTFLSKGPPAIYDLDCVCEVVNETLMAKYNKELVEWHRKQEEKKLHFTIKESDLEAANKRPGSGPSKLRSIDAVYKLNRSDSDLKKYDALPPIGLETNSTINDSGTEQHPLPPDTFPVHMGVTARTHSIEEFRSNFISVADQYIIQSTSHDAKLTKSNKPEKRNCSKEEYNVMASIMPLILMDLLEDKDFAVAIKKIRDEPVPYFGMITGDGSDDAEDCEMTMATVAAAVPMEQEMKSESELPHLEKKEAEEKLDKEDAQNTFKGKLEFEDNGERTSSIEDNMAENQRAKANETDRLLRERQTWKGSISIANCRSEEFAKLLDEVFENTVFNLMTEASNGEINLTARPRLVALPPSAKGSRKA
eukprot:gene13350-4200_t